VNKIIWLALVSMLVVGFALYLQSAPNSPEANGTQGEGVNSTPSPSETGGFSQEPAAPKNVTVEVYHFHAAQQCSSCIRVGELAEETVTTYFEGELASGKLVFGHVNIALPENKELVEKYGVTGSSLWIGTYINGEFNKEQNVNVWYKINDEADYLSYLKGILEKRLSGELN